MTYSTEQIETFNRDFGCAMASPQELMFQGVVACQDPPNDHVRRFLAHGVERRLSVLKHSIEEIFRLFPPEHVAPLSNDEVSVSGGDLTLGNTNYYTDVPAGWARRLDRFGPAGSPGSFYFIDPRVMDDPFAFQNAIYPGNKKAGQSFTLF